MPLTARSLSSEEYAALCAGRPEVSIFQQPWWMDAIAPGWKAVGAFNGAVPAGLWSLPIEAKFGFRLIRNPPLTPYLSPTVFHPAGGAPGRRDAYEQDVMTALLEAAPPAPVWSISLAPGVAQAGLLAQAGFRVSARQTFLLPIGSRSEEEVFSRMHEDTRRAVRRAADELQIADEPDSVELLYQFQSATHHRQGARLSYTHTAMQALHGAARQQGATALWVARKSGVEQAALWHLWNPSGPESIYLVGARNPETKEARALTALIWHAAMHSKALGMETFDFEGSMISGVERFFRTFGADRTLYLTASKETSLWRAARRLKSLLG